MQWKHTDGSRPFLCTFCTKSFPTKARAYVILPPSPKKTSLALELGRIIWVWRTNIKNIQFFNFSSFSFPVCFSPFLSFLPSPYLIPPPNPSPLLTSGMGGRGCNIYIPVQRAPSRSTRPFTNWRRSIPVSYATSCLHGPTILSRTWEPMSGNQICSCWRVMQLQVDF